MPTWQLAELPVPVVLFGLGGVPALKGSAPLWRLNGFNVNYVTLTSRYGMKATDTPALYWG